MTKEQERGVDMRNTEERLQDLIDDIRRNKIKVCELISEEGKYNLADDIETVLSMLKEKDKEIEHLKENINYQTLCDFLINSVSGEEEPIWTEKHIEELLENFEVRWKNAYKQNS